MAHSRPIPSALDEFLVEDAIEAGFLLPARDKQHNEIEADIISSTSGRRKTCQLACENIYTRLSHNLELQSELSCTSHSIMNLPLAEREIPYDTYVTANMHCWVPATEGTEFEAGTAQSKCNGGENCSKEIVVRSDSYYDHMQPSINNQELRQFSREPSTLNICNITVNDQITTDVDSHNHDTLRIIPNEQKILANSEDDIHKRCDISLTQKSESYGDKTLCVQSGFDSNTLKRLLQTFPNSAQQVNAQEFLCPISKSLNTNWQMAFEQHIIQQQTPSYVSNNCHMLPQNNIDAKLQTVNEQRKYFHGAIFILCIYLGLI